jgi:hypothetical protein
MYTAFLIIHSWLRWVALGAGLAATVSAAAGGAGTVDARRDRWGLILSIALDVQFVLGLLLYFLVSPTMEAIRAQFGEAMRTSQLRFWAVEHITTMFVAIVIVHVGRVLARKAATPAKRRRRQLVCYGLATLLMALGTPWPGLPYGRPLLRLE